MYLNLMQEVKNRIHSILDICIYHKRTTSFKQTNTEFCYLQLRKVLELIAFGSIVMNKDEVAKQTEGIPPSIGTSRNIKCNKSEIS